MEIPIDNSKAVFCPNPEGEMEQFHDQTETFLENVVQSRDIPMLVILHHLRDLYRPSTSSNREMNVALLTLKSWPDGRSVSEMGKRRYLHLLLGSPSTSLVFALSTQAVSICEEIVAKYSSHANKGAFWVLSRADHLVEDHPEFGAQWLGHAL